MNAKAAVNKVIDARSGVGHPRKAEAASVLVTLFAAAFFIGTDNRKRIDPKASLKHP